MSTKIEQIAAEIYRQHESRERFTNLQGDLAPADITQAYAAQSALHLLRKKGRRGSVAGRKIALASKVQQELCGIDHPIAGAIYEHEIHATPATLSLSDFHGLGIEYEIALTLNTATDTGRTYDREAIEAMLGSAHPAFEMIIDRGADYSNLNPFTMIADNTWGAGIVLGEDVLPALVRDGKTVDDLPTTLKWNSETETASTAATDPVGTLMWVVNLMSEIGEHIEPGQPVITGSVMKTRYPVAGDTVYFELNGYASLELSIN